MFPDTTVLINFAIVNRMDLLERLANGKGRWCATVRTECAESAGYEGLAALHGAAAIFGEPLFPEGAEYQDTHVLRDQLASPGDKPTQHLGEAETIAIIIRRNLQCVFVTDDKDAARLAARNGVRVAGTWQLVRLAQKARLIDDADVLWGYIQTLRDNDRGAPPGVRDRESFDEWLKA